MKVGLSQVFRVNPITLFPPGGPEMMACTKQLMLIDDASKLCVSLANTNTGYEHNCHTKTM